MSVDPAPEAFVGLAIEHAASVSKLQTFGKVKRQRKAPALARIEEIVSRDDFPDAC